LRSYRTVANAIKAAIQVVFAKNACLTREEMESKLWNLFDNFLSRSIPILKFIPQSALFGTIHKDGVAENQTQPKANFAGCFACHQSGKDDFIQSAISLPFTQID